MRIREIEVTTLRFPYPPGQGFHFAGGYCDARVSSLIQVHTDDGVSGVGSVYSHPEMVRTVIEGQLRDLFAGEDPLEVEALWQRGYSITRWYGRKGAALSALGGVDMALWDIRGKVLGKPVCQILGAQRDRVPAYASALLWKNDPAELAEEVARHLANGFRGFKSRLGRNRAYDNKALPILRRAAGGGTRLMIEGNARYPLEDALAFVPRLREHNAFWFEEPFVPEDVDSYLALRPQAGVPLAAGENEFGVQGFRELIDRGMVDIVQPDTCRAGGITECHRAGMLAHRAGLRVATHTWSDAVALVANMHLIASLPTGITVEIDQTGNALIDHLLASPLRVDEGEVALPTAPGLGIELNWDTVRRYTVPRGDDLPAGNYSDMAFGRGFYHPAPRYSAD